MFIIYSDNHLAGPVRWLLSLMLEPTGYKELISMACPLNLPCPQWHLTHTDPFTPYPTYTNKYKMLYFSKVKQYYHMIQYSTLRYTLKRKTNRNLYMNIHRNIIHKSKVETLKCLSDNLTMKCYSDIKVIVKD